MTGDPKFLTEKGDLIRDEDLPPLPVADAEKAALVRSYEHKRMAHALVTAEYEGDETAIKKFGISPDELLNARRAFYKDPWSNRQLVAAVRQVREAMATTLNEKLMGAQVAMADFLTRAARTADPSDPAAIEKVTKGLEAVSEVLMTSRMVDARLNDRPAPRKAAALRPPAEDDGDADGE